jgi:hypothetical protein
MSVKGSGSAIASFRDVYPYDRRNKNGFSKGRHVHRW